MARGEYPEFAEKYDRAEERAVEQNATTISNQLARGLKSDLRELLAEPRLAQALERGLERDRAYKEQATPPVQDGQSKYPFAEGQNAFTKQQDNNAVPPKTQPGIRSRNRLILKEK